MNKLSGSLLILFLLLYDAIYIEFKKQKNRTYQLQDNFLSQEIKKVRTTFIRKKINSHKIQGNSFPQMEMRGLLLRRGLQATSGVLTILPFLTYIMVAGSHFVTQHLCFIHTNPKYFKALPKPLQQSEKYTKKVIIK